MSKVIAYNIIRGLSPSDRVAVARVKVFITLFFTEEATFIFGAESIIVITIFK